MSAKIRQVFETTKFLEKFFLPIDFHLSETLFSKHLIESLDLLDSESSYRLRKRSDQSSSPPSSNHVSDTSDHPFFGVANAKVRQLFETTKFSEKFFSSASLVRLTPIIYRCAQRHAHQQNLLTTHKAQTLPKPRSFELRVQRYNNFSNPPNV